MNAEFNPDSFSPSGGSEKAFLKQYVPEDDDTGVIGTFFVKDEIMPFKSDQAGKEIREKRQYVRIVVKGNDKMEVIRLVTDADKKRFPYAWQQFERGLSQSERGTPLSEIFDSESNIIPHYHAHNVFTLEDLSQIIDSNLSQLGAGARENRLKAKEYLEKTKGAADEIAQLKAQIAELQKKQK